MEKNDRTKEEFHQVIEWLTGFDEEKLQELIAAQATFFEQATIHPNAEMIKGVGCGYRIEKIADEFEAYKECRRTHGKAH